MSSDTLLQSLHPTAIASTPLRGRYLAENLHHEGSLDNPFIYANYVSSIDGRIAIPGKDGQWATPNHLTTTSDWSLFKELQAQAECLITHSGYLRALANGSQGNILQIPSGEDDTYLQTWRKQAGLPSQPHILIISSTLDFFWPESLDTQHQSVSVLTTVPDDHDSIVGLRKRGVEMFFSNAGQSVTAEDVYRVLTRLKLRTAYLQTGPELLQSLLTMDVVRRLYLTLNLTLTGGAEFLTMLAGDIPFNRKSMRLRSLYLRNADAAVDTDATNEDAQLFAAFDL